MMKNKLVALKHPTPDNLDCNGKVTCISAGSVLTVGFFLLTDRKVFASTVLWLEDQKIREYRIEDREGLRQVDSADKWEKAYTAYKQDVGMPKLTTPVEELSWLLSYAVRLEYLDDPDKYKDLNSKEILAKNSKSQEPTIKAQNSFDKLDCESFSSTQRKI